MDQTVIVTGAAGFIGAALTRTLSTLGAKVHAVVHGSTWRLDDSNCSAVLERVDITDQTAVARLYDAVRPTFTFHAAAYGVAHSSQDVIQAGKVNILGGLNLLVAAQLVPHHRFVNLGTRYESERAAGPIREDDPQTPVGVYGTTKYSAQLIMEDAARKTGLIFRTATLFGVYGPMDGQEKFIPYVVDSLLRRNAPRLSGCEQVRNFTYIDDAVHGLLLLAGLNGTGVMRVNIGTDRSVSLRQVVRILEDGIQSGCAISFGELPYRKDEIWHLVPDLATCRRLLSWSPGVALEDGLERTVQWHRTRVATPDARRRMP